MPPTTRSSLKMSITGKIDGSKIFDEIISYKDRICVETGIYIVRIDGKSFKVTVR